MRLLRSALSLAAAASAVAADLTGSDLAGPVIAPALRKTAPELSFEFTGTFDALRALRAGKTAAVLAFLRPGEMPPEVKSGEWVATAVAHQPVIVAVNRANKAAEIDLPTLAGLYGESNDTRFDTWRCLPSSELTQGPLAIAPHPGKGVTVSHFRSEVLAGGAFRKGIRFVADADDEESRATTTVNAIALLARQPKSGNLKVLAVSDGRPGKSAKAYFPTDSAIHSGDYPLSVPLFVIFRRADTAKAAPVVRAVLSNEVCNPLENNELRITPENIRKKFTQTLDESR